MLFSRLQVKLITIIIIFHLLLRERLPMKNFFLRYTCKNIFCKNNEAQIFKKSNVPSLKEMWYSPNMDSINMDKKWIISGKSRKFSTFATKI